MESDKTTSTPSNEVNTGGQQKRALLGRTTGPTRRSTKGQWTAEEDEILRKAVQCFKGKNWKKIAECFKDRTDVQCLHRWQKVLDPELVKGPWSKEEDELIVELVKKYGPKKWSMIAQHLPGRIGKQCRERWHNHLNPNINKQAWTQEEELALIRAHQIYGNKWAELTKFLPGRSDNAIKNHWNSSVKKKLNSYLASGLLAQFQGLPHVSHTNQSMPSSSSTVQSEDDSIPKDGTEAEEISECSQGSTVVGCSQSTSDMGNVVSHKREERRLTEECSHGMDPSFSSVTYSENYHLAFQEVAFSAPVVPSESGDFSKLLEHSFSHDLGNEQLNSNELLNITSVEPGNESSEFFLPFQLQTSVGLSALLMGDMGLESDEPDYVLVSENGCCRVIYPEPHTDGCSLAGNQTNCSNLLGFVGSTVPSLYQLSNYQIPEAADPPKSDMLRTSCSHPFSVTSQLPADDGAIFCCHSSNPFNDLSHGNQEEELVKHPYGGFGYTNDSINSLYDNGTHNMGQPNQAKDSSKLVSVDVFSSGPSSNIQTCSSVNDNPNVPNEQQDAGALFYEPPRFPSLDIPFFSCDLIQSGNDTQEEYSPLGIRRLMMSNMNCFTPIRLWSSPFRNDSPDAMLKSAAKTFTYTPSILKKRNRSLVSPMSEKRIEKKLDTNTNEESFSVLARNVSRVDVMFDENGDKYKENLGHALELGKQEGGDSTLDNLIPEKELDSTNLPDKIKQGTSNVDAKCKGDSIVATQHMQQPSGVLVEQNTNELLFFSPDRFKIKFDRSLGPGSRSLGKRSSRRLRNTWNQGAFSESLSGKPCSSSILSSPTISGKVDERRLVEAMSGNDAHVENLSLFGETPFKRSIESPSAWKSPWFMNSFVPGPRVDTDITIEDIGYFMSPGDRSYDAIGLMKQISDHTATAFAGAQVVLGDETPETILKKRFSNNQKPDHNAKCVLKSPPENQSRLASNILTEGRALDFSECGTPGKGKERGKFSSAKGCTSPSSYLLKSCR